MLRAKATKDAKKVRGAVDKVADGSGGGGAWHGIQTAGRGELILSVQVVAALVRFRVKYCGRPRRRARQGHAESDLAGRIMVKKR